MSVQTLLLEVRASTSSNKKDFEKIDELIEGTLEKPKYFGPGCLNKILRTSDLAIFNGPKSSIITVRTYEEQYLVTVSIEYYLHDGETPLLTIEDCKDLEGKWSSKLGGFVKCTTLPAVHRGLPFDRYFLSTDQRLLEYDIDEMLYDAHSPFQHIQIAHSKTYGNMLILDGDQNLAESDLIYTESLMKRGIENYENQEILILGGGDGGLLFELLKEDPKHVTMIDIDRMVTEACRKHMRSVCGNVFDNYFGKNYEIIIEDCRSYLAKLKDEGIKFDYIFNDLTTIPVSGDTHEQKTLLEFQMTVLDLVCAVLKPTGKLMAHGPGASELNSTKLYEQILYNSIPQNYKIKLSKQMAFIPSFIESWSFYEVELEKIV